jgi:membrane protease YdiL (CAAX protease family)
MTRAIRRIAREHPVATFLPLAFLLSWYPWLLALAQGRSTGPNPLGPFAAALVVTGLAAGWPAVKALLGRMVKGRVAPRWYLLALGLPVALVAAVVAINHLCGAPLPTRAQLADWTPLLDQFVVVLLFVALGEEPGWRGFLLPRLQQRCSSVAANLVLGAIWAVWHVPLLGSEIAPAMIAPFLVGVFAGTFVLARLYDGTGGSVLLPMLMHATINTIGAGFVFRFVQGDDLVRMWWINAGVWVVAAVACAWRSNVAAASRSGWREAPGRGPISPRQ